LLFRRLRQQEDEYYQKREDADNGYGSALHERRERRNSGLASRSIGGCHLAKKLDFAESPSRPFCHRTQRVLCDVYR
jgi:hypothetical protein